MKKYKELLAYLNLDYKNELIKLTFLSAGLLLINVAIFLFFKQPLILLISGVISLLIIYLFVNRYSQLKNILLKEREDEFVNIISYFQIYISNNFNVYNSIQSLLPYCSIWMKEKINKLLNEIDNDKSVQPFINFATEFENNLIENLLLSIYQMIEEGENTASINQFSLLFKDIGKKHQEEQLKRHIKKLESLNIFPLIGAASITVLLTLGVLSIVGDLVNVI